MSIFYLIVCPCVILATFMVFLKETLTCTMYMSSMCFFSLSLPSYTLCFPLCFLPSLPPLSHSDIEYVYRVKRVPYMDYSLKQIVPLSDGEGKRRMRRRMLRKMYAIRVEFDQGGSLGEPSKCACDVLHCTGIQL